MGMNMKKSITKLIIFPIYPLFNWSKSGFTVEEITIKIEIIKM